MKRPVLLTIAALVIAAAASVSAIAQPPQGFGRGPERGMGPGGPGFGMLQRLDLNEEQRTQIRSILDQRKQAAADREGPQLQKQLREALFADTPDTAKIEELKAALTAAHAAALNEHVALHLQIAHILTPEQRQKARELEGGRSGRGGPGPRGRGGRF
jgi:Spy/CpxP family protein refolding chaperone